MGIVNAALVKVVKKAKNVLRVICMGRRGSGRSLYEASTATMTRRCQRFPLSILDRGRGVLMNAPKLDIERVISTIHCRHQGSPGFTLTT